MFAAKLMKLACSTVLKAVMTEQLVRSYWGSPGRVFYAITEDQSDMILQGLIWKGGGSGGGLYPSDLQSSRTLYLSGPPQSEDWYSTP